MDKQSVIAMILDVLEELNRQLKPEQRVPVATDSRLYYKGGRLDSLALVNLIVLVEERVAEQWGVEVSLSDVTLTSRTNNPFESVDALADHLCRLVAAGHP